jgi:hypothetical protein
MEKNAVEAKKKKKAPGGRYMLPIQRRKLGVGGEFLQLFILRSSFTELLEVFLSFLPKKNSNWEFIYKAPGVALTS